MSKVLSCECMGWAPTYPVYRSTYHHPDCPWKPECASRPLTPAEAERAAAHAPSVVLSEERIQEIVKYATGGEGEGMSDRLSLPIEANRWNSVRATFAELCGLLP